MSLRSEQAESECGIALEASLFPGLSSGLRPRLVRVDQRLKMSLAKLARRARFPVLVDCACENIATRRCHSFNFLVFHHRTQ